MVTTKKFARNIHEPLQFGEELNVIADSVIREYNNFLVELTNMKVSVQIDTATGIDLDNIATLFGLSREIGETDSQFRARIKAYFPGVVGSGTINEILNTINRMTGIALEDIDITEIESNKFRISFGIGTDFSLIDTVKDIIWDIKTAGVYPFFKIDSGISDETTVTDGISIIVTNRFYYGNTSWGEAKW